MGLVERIFTRAISFILMSLSSSSLWSVLISILYWISVIIARASAVVCLRTYFARGRGGVALSQQSITSKSCCPSGRFSLRTSMSPRLMSISSSKVMVTDIGGKASSSSPVRVWMPEILLSNPDGRATTLSPFLKIPPATRPAYPRKSWYLSL